MQMVETLSSQKAIFAPHCCRFLMPFDKLRDRPPPSVPMIAIFDLSLSSPSRLGINAETDSEGSLKAAVKKEDFGIHAWRSMFVGCLCQSCQNQISVVRHDRQTNNPHLSTNSQFPKTCPCPVWPQCRSSSNFIGKPFTSFLCESKVFFLRSPEYLIIRPADSIFTSFFCESSFEFRRYVRRPMPGLRCST